MTQDVIRVMIADDQGIVRKGISALLATEPGIVVVEEAGDGRAAVERALAVKPDVILMDLMMPVMDGIEATRQITKALTGTRVLVLTSFAANDQVFPAIKAGALGYLLKDSSPEELVEAIRQVYRGEAWLHPTIARKVMQELAKPAAQPAEGSPDDLTEREMDVLKLLTQGQSNKEIAERLVVSEATVRTHVSNILNKLHLASRTQAALYALRQGIISLKDTQDPDMPD